MEEDEEHLGDVGDHNEGSGDIDDGDELAILVANPTVEGKTRQAADDQGGGVDEMCPEVKRFCEVDSVDVEHIRDVLDVTTGAQVYQDGAEDDEGEVWNLVEVDVRQCW